MYQIYLTTAIPGFLVHFSLGILRLGIISD